MEILKIPILKNMNILALGAESAGRFCFYENGNISISYNFGDLLEEKNFEKYKNAILKFIKDREPDAILSDLHPLYRTTTLGAELSQKFKIPHIQVQHHLAHIFSAAGDRIIHDTKYMIPNTFYGIASDGTGYGLDGNIWGGEAFRIQFSIFNFQFSNKSQITINNKQKAHSNSVHIDRIGSLEEQTMIGGDLAVREPARMLIAILAKLKAESEKRKFNKEYLKSIKTEDDIFNFVKIYYTRNDFELLYNQLLQNFNCQKTTSAGRVLDAVSVLLGFAGNERKYKHEATKLLEKCSGQPYNFKPKMAFSVIASELDPPIGEEGERNNHLRMNNLNRKQAERLPRRSDDYIGNTGNDKQVNDKRLILQTTPLFEYLIKNINRDKGRLAATAQLYIAKGLYEIINSQNTKCQIENTIFGGGGMMNNKIISSYLSNKGVYVSKTIPRGDEGIAFGEIVFYLFQIKNC